MSTMTEAEPKPLAYVPETILKKRKTNDDWAIKRKERLDQRRAKNKASKQFAFKRPEDYIKAYRSKMKKGRQWDGKLRFYGEVPKYFAWDVNEEELDLVHMKQRKKLRKPWPVTPNSSLLFIVRIRSASAMHPKARKILHLLKLSRIFDGVFVKANEGIMDMLGRIEPYVTYGYPNLKSVKELVYKKGYGRVDRQKVPLTDNNIIEQELGKYGIICLEDIVHEIATVGRHFKEVTSFLWPFKLNRPEGGLQGKKQPFKDGGDSGNREDHINELINKMN